MKVPTSLMIVTIFQLFKCATAYWHPRSPLTLVHNQYYDNPIFPKVVREVNQYQVYINEGEENFVITYAYCPNSHYGDPNCNYSATPQNHELVPNLPTQICESKVDFQMIPKINPENIHQNCAHNWKYGNEYHFVYWRCQYGIVERASQIIYELCYDVNLMEMILGEYKIHIPSLLANPNLEDQQSYEFELDTTHHYNPHTRKISRIANELYYAARNVPVMTQYYVPRPVLPPEWIEYAHQKKPLYNFMNCAPMNVGLILVWEKLMMDLKPKIAELHGSIYISAGLIGKIQGDPYLGIMDEIPVIPISKVFWVMITEQGRTRGLVIAIDNEILHPGQEDYFHRYCDQEYCHDAKIGNLLPKRQINRGNPFIYCCYPRAITEKFDLNVTNELLTFEEY